MKLLEERPVALPEVKELLEKRKKEGIKTRKLEEKIKEATPAPALTVESTPEEQKQAEAPKEEAGELSYEQQNTLDYAEKFAKMSVKNAAELDKKLREIGALTEKQTVAIINILPKKPEELKAILAKDKIELDEEQIKTVIKLAKEYQK
ncbi:MAG: hypothetical protein NTY90_02680 [Candidatus Micrarchaeota archaeon]|nr:hypothetical protein [Candidatus Micrarchaeota archaeon]